MNERFEQLDRRVSELDTRTTTAHRELQDSIRERTVHLVQHGSLVARVRLRERDIVDIVDIVDIRRRVLRATDPRPGMAAATWTAPCQASRAPFGGLRPRPEPPGGEADDRGHRPGGRQRRRRARSPGAVPDWNA